MRRSLETCLIAAALALSACGGDDESGPEPGPTSTASASSTPTTLSAPAASPSATEAVSAFEFVDSDSDDAAKIADLLRPAGPYAGDAFDLEMVVDELKQRDLQSADEWTQAIIDATHGDHAVATQGLLDFDPSIGEDPGTPVEKLGKVEVVGSNHFAVVLDASGSMAESAGGETRMQQAKAAVRLFAAELPRSSTLSLRVYGHKGSNSGADKARSCAATDVLYEGAPKGVGAVLSTFEPTGWTPLASSLQAAQEDIPEGASDAIVYVVTDGIETCGGDPVKAARQLAKAGTKPIVNVIGFQVGNADQAQLRRIAEAGGGDFTDARSGAELSSYWKVERQRMLEAWGAWRSKAIDRIRKQGRRNIEEAQAHGNTLLDGISQEYAHQTEILDLLRDDETLDYETLGEVSAQLYDRKGALWMWSYDTKGASWLEAYDIRSSRWNEAYDLGSGKWSEYYAKNK